MQTQGSIMAKIVTLVLALIFTSCSHFTFNKQICSNIEAGDDIPQECIPYVEEDIKKAFEAKQNKQTDKKDLIEFNKKDK